MAIPTLWMYWDATGLTNCSQCPAMAGTATGSGATGSEGVKFNTAIGLDTGGTTCGAAWTIPSGGNAFYGFTIVSVGSAPNRWTLLAHPHIGPAYYLLASFTFDCSLGWAGHAFNLPSTGANANATGTLTITFS